jgi:hypothetical protein
VCQPLRGNQPLRLPLTARLCVVALSIFENGQFLKTVNFQKLSAGYD